MFTVGLTGGIGSGKSSAAKIFTDLGICVIDADLAARAVVGPGSAALQEIASHFGSAMLMANGALDRKALRTKVFSDPDARRWLEALLHPLIHRHIEEQLRNAGSAYAVLESPLLLETGQHKLTDRILVIDVPEEIQLQRALSRDGGDEQEIKSIIASQMGREERLSYAQDVILNTDGFDKLEQQVLLLHRKYLELAKHD